jgi:Polyketide cyclase / dehydrase and lipid transport
MAAEIHSATTIARPVEDVFQFLLDLDQHPTDPGVESVVKSPNGPSGPGTTLRFAHGKGRETIMRFTTVDPGRRIGFEGRVGPLRPVGDFSFARDAGRTRLTVRVAPNPAAPLKLLSPLVNRVGQRAWDHRLERIKAALERG